MQEPEQNSQNDFMREKIKERPVNKRKLIRRTLITAAMAVIFGMIACVTFIVLEPMISKKLYPPEETPSIPVQPIVFPEDQEEEEMLPEDMLADNISAEEEPKDPEEPEAPEEPPEPESVTLGEEQIQEILSGVVLNKENYKQIYTALSDYVDELKHSMVTITGVSSNVDWFNNVEQRKKQSSGVIVANNGVELLILADYGPLQDAESMTMEFSFVDAETNEKPGYQLPIVLKARDYTTNLAVLSVELDQIPASLQDEKGLVIAYLGSSNTRNVVGMPVVALGSPMGVSESVGYGMVTAISGQTLYTDTNYRLMQTDILGSPTGGGVLFNMQGQVVGIITGQKNSADVKNIVCAYGITELKKRIEKMSNGIPIAYFGISGMDVTPEVHTQSGIPYGTFIRDIDMDSPAMQAGIQKGDVIVLLGEHHIQSYNEYISALMQTEVYSTVEVTVMRAVQEEYREMVFEVTLGER